MKTRKILNICIFGYGKDMKYYFPFGETVKPLVQRTELLRRFSFWVFSASAVHARWKNGASTKCHALAVASEPRIFWDGNPKGGAEIISRIKIPQEMGTLEPADEKFNGPSAKVLDEHILAPLGFTRKDAWLCDLLPETRLNDGQVEAT